MEGRAASFRCQASLPTGPPNCRPGVAAFFASLLVLSAACSVQAQDNTAVNEPVEHIYASPDSVELKAYVFSGRKTSVRQRRPAIVLFHGGGWTIGEPQWAFPQAKHFAKRGMIAVAAQYRLSDQKEITPL